MAAPAGMFGPPEDLAAGQLHPRALAYLGDAVYELYVRQEALRHETMVERLHEYVIQRVRAEYQADLLETWQEALSAEEQEVVRRARNMPVSVGRRSQQALHRQATAFEALVGYWYLTQPDRLTARLQALPEPESQG